jgi:hypothetical protein
LSQAHAPLAGLRTEKEGLALCDRHSGIRTLTDDSLIAQIIFGTAARRLRLRRIPGPLPMLPTPAVNNQRVGGRKGAKMLAGLLRHVVQ